MLLVVLPPLLLVAFMDVFEQCLPPALAISANNIILDWMKPNWFITVHFAEVINPTQQAGI